MGLKKGVCVDTTELDTSSSKWGSSLDEDAVVNLCCPTCRGLDVAALFCPFCLNGLSLCGRSVGVGLGLGLAVVLPLLIFLRMAAISSFLSPSLGVVVVVLCVVVVGFR